MDSGDGDLFQFTSPPTSPRYPFPSNIPSHYLPNTPAFPDSRTPSSIPTSEDLRYNGVIQFLDGVGDALAALQNVSCAIAEVVYSPVRRAYWAFDVCVRWALPALPSGFDDDRRAEMWAYRSRRGGRCAGGGASRLRRRGNVGIPVARGRLTYNDLNIPAVTNTVATTTRDSSSLASGTADTRLLDSSLVGERLSNLRANTARCTRLRVAVSRTAQRQTGHAIRAHIPTPTFENKRPTTSHVESNDRRVHVSLWNAGDTKNNEVTQPAVSEGADRMPLDTSSKQASPVTRLASKTPHGVVVSIASRGNAAEKIRRHPRPEANTKSPYPIRERDVLRTSKSSPIAKRRRLSTPKPVEHRETRDFRTKRKFANLRSGDARNSGDARHAKSRTGGRNARHAANADAADDDGERFAEIRRRGRLCTVKLARAARSKRSVTTPSPTSRSTTASEITDDSSCDDSTNSTASSTDYAEEPGASTSLNWKTSWQLSVRDRDVPQTNHRNVAAETSPRRGFTAERKKSATRADDDDDVREMSVMPSGGSRIMMAADDRPDLRVFLMRPLASAANSSATASRKHRRTIRKLR